MDPSSVISNVVRGVVIVVMLLLLLPPLVVILRLRHRSSTSMRVAIRRLLLPPPLVPLALIPPMVPTQSKEFMPLPPLLLLPTMLMLEFFRFPRPALLVPLLVARAPSAGCRGPTGETRAAPPLLLLVVGAVVVGIMVWLALDYCYSLNSTGM